MGPLIAADGSHQHEDGSEEALLQGLVLAWGHGGQAMERGIEGAQDRQERAPPSYVAAGHCRDLQPGHIGRTLRGELCGFVEKCEYVDMSRSGVRSQRLASLDVWQPRAQRSEGCDGLTGLPGPLSPLGWTPWVQSTESAGRRPGEGMGHHRASQRPRVKAKDSVGVGPHGSPLSFGWDDGVSRWDEEARPGSS